MSRSGFVGIMGQREQGQDVRTANVTAVQAIANIVKSSLGPQGLDKMLVDDIGDVTITNDGATILKLLEVEHPAGKVLVQLSNLQDQEVGDGTTSVVILAAELLRRANELVKNRIHPTSVMAGFRLAMREAVKYIQENLSQKIEALGKDVITNIAKTSMSSKLIGPEGELFAKLVVDAVMAVKFTNERGEIRYPIKSVNVLKCHGRSSQESTLINGYALQLSRASQALPMRVTNAKIALIDFNLNKYRMAMGIQVLVNDPRNLDGIRQREMDITKERVQKIINAGANVILTSAGIDDMSMKYLVEAGMYAVRRVKKEDLRRIAKATGGTTLLTMANLEGEESFDPAFLGHADEIMEDRVGDNDFTFIKGCKTSRAQTILLRGANEFMLDEIERSLHDSICVVARTLESNAVVPGGGAVEAALSIYLDDFARTLGSREQLAIAEFSEALLIIPKTLAVNAAQDATELVAKLRTAHNLAQTSEDPSKRDLKWSGLDLINGKIRNNLAAGVIEPTMSKVKSIKFATEAAVTILRIDDMIKLAPQEEGQGHH
eukprot:GILK01000458.1.p1 GENE.GILK01000458.1~~GILK01000458.1.p1  ORF type:complete len:548 (-),score=80.02 GILK01000458.1:68-1711(-)